MTKRPIHLPIFAVVSMAILLLVGCAQQSPTEALREFSAEEHFAAAQQCKATQEDLSLAIWHYQQFLQDADSTDQLVPIAKIELGQCLKDFLSENAVSQDQGATLKDKEEQLRLLRLRNAELESWISRLSTENLSLRQALLKAQEGQK